MAEKRKRPPPRSSAAMRKPRRKTEQEEQRLLDRTRAAFADKSEEQIVTEVGLVIEEVRQEERSRRSTQTQA